MNRNLRFGIIGGYGETGRVVAAELLKSTSAELLLGGRDLKKASELAAQSGTRVSAARMDVNDPGSLHEFCDRCSIVVNCAGPVMLVQDRVAQAAFQRHCHYVDVAGLSFVKEGMLPRSREMAQSGLSCIVSAGWLPGLTELLPVYAHALARAKMDAIESLTAYFGDSGEWSMTAFRDMWWYLRQSGVPAPIYFRRGSRVRGGMRQRSVRINLGSPVGVYRFNMVAMPEFEEVGQRLDDCDASSHTYLPGARAAMAATMVALLPISMERGARLLSSAIRDDSIGVGGFIVVDVNGKSQGRKLGLTVQMTFDKQRGYWLNGLVAATVARMISEGKCIPGVNYLSSALDASDLVGELSRGGIEVSERLIGSV